MSVPSTSGLAAVVCAADTAPAPPMPTSPATTPLRQERGSSRHHETVAVAA